MPASIGETTAARLESTAARARALLGVPAGGKTAHEATEAAGGASLGAADVGLIAARVRQHSSLDAAAAARIADELVQRAGSALSRLARGNSGASLTQDEALALESVLQVRGRPAVRVLARRLESLERHPGSEFWQEFIAEHESRIIGAAAVTGAAIVSAPATGNPPCLRGSAWLIAPDRVVTNRHVLLCPELDVKLVERSEAGAMRVRTGYTITIEFAADDRAPGATIRRRVTAVRFLASLADPVDIGVLAIEPISELAPLTLAASAGAQPANLFVVGHPGPVSEVPDAVKSVFGNPDGRKRVSFGKRLAAAVNDREFAHDASTIGGYSGGPVLGISDGKVAGLHYYGDPVAGNLAITAGAIRAHAAYGHMS